MFSIVIYSAINSPIVKNGLCTAEVKSIIDSLEKGTVFSVYSIDDENVTMNFLDR